ncbi:hypothetical protein AJ80_02372 [Polytolypa hystricis UAMH7299]|uniref:Uncharacterized protein n=1 Tax=Polytolypa hystricis (strain UAMH7299) TaxID=1447883 RepID=A0A2B7YRV1_POLH7|nr:hypothetical protein AJ80_02372 [Polytolypa hystricis UAMH7299]
MTTQSSNLPLSGLWQPHSHLQHLYYGPSSVEKHLLSTLPSPSSSKVFIITGTSIATKTPLLHNLEHLLGTHHAGTYAGIKQHGPIACVDEATQLVARDPSIDTILSLGGGAAIDSAKTVSFRTHSRTGKWLTHLSIPTTLSAAECTAAGGYTGADGVKTGLGAARMGVTAIFYDPGYAKYTPRRLWLATGMRAVDHAVESYYHPYSSEMPWKVLSYWALTTLFELLPQTPAAGRPEQLGDEEAITRLLLAAYASSGFRGRNFKGGMGLSHSLGHALGSPYGIPHGETSCITLGHVVKYKAKNNPDDARQIARLLPATGGTPSGDDFDDALEVGDRILRLVDTLGLRQELGSRGVGKDQIPIIVERAMGGIKSGPEYDAVVRLVDSFF